MQNRILHHDNIMAVICNFVFYIEYSINLFIVEYIEMIVQCKISVANYD